MKRFLSYQLPHIIWGLLILAFVFELLRDVHRDGDFMGYVNAGNAVLNGTPIYADYLNTWPPFFAVFSVPLAIVNNISPVLIRAIWLIGIAFAWIGILRLSSKLFLHKNLTLKASNDEEISVFNWLIILPLLFVFRFVIDDISNLQINSYLLLVCLFVLSEIEKGKTTLPATILALIISLKVYPVFLLAFLLWKRYRKIAGLSVLGLLVINGVSFLIFGFETALSNYHEWVATRLSGPIIIHHKNQSIFGFCSGLFSDISRGEEIKYNLLSLESDLAKKLTILIILLAAILPAWKMRNSHKSTLIAERVWEYALILAVITLVSPLAWKYYFVFLFPLYLVTYNQIRLKKVQTWMFVTFFMSIALNILSTDGIIGRRASDIMEVYGCITFGSLLLLITGFSQYWALLKLKSGIKN